MQVKILNNGKDVYFSEFLGIIIRKTSFYMSLTTTAICLIACHGGPADHFATFAENLTREGYKVEVYASGPALKKFQDRHIEVMMSFNPDNLSVQAGIDLATQIAKRCANASVVLTDLGHSFDMTLQKALATEAPQVLRLTYYDNPEPYVPGGYSNVAGEVMFAAQKVLFANANLQESSIYQEPNKEIKLSENARVGVGYYPIAQADKLTIRRKEEHDKLRAQFLAKHGLEDRGQKVLVYFGGNNEEYFTKAFPAFLKFLSKGNLSNIVIVLQQHPGAKSQNRDRYQVESWVKEYGKAANSPRVVVSDEATDQMQVVADGALYYQTSMGPLFALAGIPTIQVAHETYSDILVRNGLCPSVTNPTDFITAIAAIKPVEVSEMQRRTIYKGLGIREDWFELFKQALQTSSTPNLSKKKSVWPYFLAAVGIAATGYLAFRFFKTVAVSKSP